MTDPKAPPKGTAAYNSWARRYGPNPTKKQTDKFIQQFKTDNLKQEVKQDEKDTNAAYADLLKQQRALTKTLSDSVKLVASSYSQTGTTAVITLKYTATTIPTTGTYVYIHNLKNVPDSTFLGSYTAPDSSGTPFKMQMVRVSSATSSSITVTTYTSQTLNVSTAGPIYFHAINKDPYTTISWYNYWSRVDLLWAAKDKASAKYQKIDAKYQNDTAKLAKLVGSGNGGSGGSGGSGGNGNGGGAKTLDGNNMLNYNMPSVRWAYFSTNVGGKQPDGSSSIGYDTILLNQGGSPATQGQINDAMQLWTNPNSGAQKGMIQTFTGWKKRLSGAAADAAKKSTNRDPNVPDWYISSSYQERRYGFQFLYNPSNVTQGWGGTPAVDPGLLMSGKDATPFITPTQTASYLSFDLVINRMPDMALLNGLGPEAVAADLDKYYSLSSKSANDMATADTTYLQELEAIQELGTMYDIEYLLSTLIGFREYSALRGRYTADFGFLMGLPVELHLGKQLRYVGTIMDMSVTHTIFTAGMVPVFTNLSINFARRVEPFNGTAEISSKGSLLSVSPTGQDAAAVRRALRS